MYRVVAPDLLGHGESAKPRGDYSLGAFAAGCATCSMNSASPWRQWLANHSAAVSRCSLSISIAIIASGWC